jgi:hypothetical protein
VQSTEPLLERRHAATIAKVCREIETAESMPSLASLASRAGLSLTISIGSRRYR